MTTSGAETRPILVCGVGRSGTSLVQSMLAAHSCLAFPPETSFLRRLLATGAITHALNHGGDAECLQLLGSDQWVGRTGLKSKELLERARSESAVTGGGLYKALLHLYAERLGKPCYGDKDPRSIEYLWLVGRILPDVQVLHVIRDPRDVLSSKKKAAWSLKRGSLHHIFANYVQMRIGRTEGASLLGRNYHELVYEALIADPEAVLRDLCQKLGLAFEPGMLEFGSSAKGLVSESEMSWKKETLGPLLKDNHGKWQQSLSDWEVALTELVCVDAFEAGGYEKSGRIEELSLAWRIGVHTAAAGMRVLDPIYRLYRRVTVWRARRYV